MVIIRCNALISAKAFAEAYEGLVGMVGRGVILLPNNFELLNEVPPDTEVVVVRPDAPADVEEAKHSEWIFHNDGSGTCKRCGFTQKNVWDYDNWQNFCGHCGAKMDGKGGAE